MPFCISVCVCLSLSLSCAPIACMQHLGKEAVASQGVRTAFHSSIEYKKKPQGRQQILRKSLHCQLPGKETNYILYIYTYKLYIIIKNTNKITCFVAQLDLSNFWTTYAIQNTLSTVDPQLSTWRVYPAHWSGEMVSFPRRLSQCFLKRDTDVSDSSQTVFIKL